MDEYLFEDEYLSELLINTIEEKDWIVSASGQNLWELSHLTQHGEPFTFTVNEETFIEDVKKACSSFDPDDYVFTWLSAKQNGTPDIPDVYDLCHNASDIEEWLDDLEMTLRWRGWM